MFFLVSGAIAAANEPAEAAIDFLGKVRLGTINLDPGTDTAISPHTSPGKRKEIAKRIERFAADLGKGKLESAGIKTDGDLAGVLIRDKGGFDPSRMRVYAIALVKWKNTWLPAPIPASFENTGAGWSVEQRGKISLLESWMLRTQIAELEHLRDDSETRMKADIASAIDISLLRSDATEKICEKFLAACSRRDLPAVLGFLGGSQKKLPEDWAERLRSAESAITAGRKTGWPWRLVMAPEVVRVPVDDGGERINPVLSFACLDPAGRGLKPTAPKVEILHLELSKDDEGLWKIDLPPAFFLSPGDQEDEAEDDFEQELLDAFPGGVRKINPAAPAASLEEAAAALNGAFRAGSLLPLFSLMDLEGDPGAASRGCGLAAKAWWLIHNPDAPKLALPLGFHENGRSGVVAFQFFSPREPAGLDIRTFYFEKTKAGWLMIPGLKLTNSPSESQTAVRAWADDRIRTWKETWQPALLAECPKLDAVEAGNAPPPNDARKLVEAWLAATHRGNIAEMIGMITIANHQGETSRTLQNIGYEISTALRDDGRVSIIHTEQGKTWTAVGVKSQAGGSATFPLYLVVSTPAGPRLLIGADLFGDTTSGRDRLNDGVLNRIKTFAAEESIIELRDMIAGFRKAIPR